jgi:hypothetical protein
MVVAAILFSWPSHGHARPEGVPSVVPGGQLGQYRHGTYPSRGARTHAGVDIVAPCGTPVLAIEAGTIVDRIRSRSDPDFPSLGYMLIVEHSASATERAFYSLYLHLQAPPVAGERVARGAELGRVGATGRATGCHLHLEVRYFRDRVSPQWQHIYGPGDQRASPHFQESWEDPVAFVIARLERRRQAAAAESGRPGVSVPALGRWSPGRGARTTAATSVPTGAPLSSHGRPARVASVG